MIVMIRITALMMLAGLAFLPFATATAGTLPNLSGTWYQGGDSSKRCFILQHGNTIQLTNERGEVATGSLLEPNRLTTNWGPNLQIEGHISGSQQTIFWSNSTYWTRDVTAANAVPDVSGIWYLGGNPAKRCYVSQHGKSLTLTNQRGKTATGKFITTSRIATSWGPKLHVNGHISADRQRIDWSNSTDWTRGSY